MRGISPDVRSQPSVRTEWIWSPYTKYALSPNTNKQSCYWFSAIWKLYSEICPSYLGKGGSRGPFSAPPPPKKNYLTKRTTFIQLYNNSGLAPDLNILFLFTGDWTQVYQFVFGSTEIRTEMVSIRRRGFSGRDGQVHVLLLGGRGGHGAVILLFLRAPGGGQGRAFAVMRSSSLSAAFPLLFVLDSAVLKPDFHLLLGQVEVRGDLDAPQSGEVHVWGELSL